MLLSLLYWIVLILSVIGYFVPIGPNPPTWGYRLSGGAATVLFVLIGLRDFRVSLQ